MPIVLECPSCGKRYSVAETAAGKHVKCVACSSMFEVPAVAAAVRPRTASGGPAGRETSGGKPALAQPTPRMSPMEELLNESVLPGAPDGFDPLAGSSARRAARTGMPPAVMWCTIVAAVLTILLVAYFVVSNLLGGSAPSSSRTAPASLTKTARV